MRLIVFGVALSAVLAATFAISRRDVVVEWEVEVNKPTLGGGKRDTPKQVAVTPTVELNASEPCGEPSTSDWRIPLDFDAEDYCGTVPTQRDPTKHLKARRVPARIYYGIMMNTEVEMLDLVLHEIFPVVDKVILVESTVSHSLLPKESFVKSLFNPDGPHGTRFMRYASKVVHHLWSPRRTYLSGWDIEKRQRQAFFTAAHSGGIVEGDIAVANMDLDELISFRMLLRLKYCADDIEDPDDPQKISFDLVHFRYNLNCLTETSLTQYQRTIFRWRADKYPSLYTLRKSTVQVPIPLHNISSFLRERRDRLAWHMSTFGGVNGILQKRKNSPHRFVGERENADAVALMESSKKKLTFDEANAIVMETQISKCFFMTPRTPVALDRDVLPRAFRHPSADCQFLRNGFIRQRPATPLLERAM